MNPPRFRAVLFNAGGYVVWDSDRDEPIYKNRRKHQPRVWDRLGPAVKKAAALNRKKPNDQRSLFR